MDRKTTKHTGSFSATADDGKKYTINVFTNYIETKTLDGKTSTVEGLKNLRTDNGHHVNRISKGKYEILGAIKMIPVSSDDPKAV